MTANQKDYLITLINKDAQIENLPLVMRRNALTKTIADITSKITEANDRRTALITKRNALNDLIVEREATATALAGVIVID